ncbi:MAG TPA: pitrilysin family protein [Casimicrobiaceae bacterium]
MIRYRLARALALIAFFVTAGAVALALPDGVKQGPTVEGITEYALTNGLKVLLFPDASQPKTTVNITYLVGSRHESYGETGMAHLLEHLMFKGTPTSGSFLDAMSRRGMQFNGTTWYDRTNYYETFNASDADLDWALAMEADRMVHSKIARTDLDSEMTVVRNEMERGENNPFQMLLQRLGSTSFDWHNYGKSTIGARSDVENVDIGRLQAFYRTYYQPDDAVLIVAGRFDADKTLAAIARLFGPIPKPARVLPRLYTEEPVQDGERSVTLRRAGDTQLVGVSYHIVPGAHTDFVPLQALVNVMTIAPAGRLYKALVDARKATSVGGFARSLHDPGFIVFFAQLPPTDSLDAARSAMVATLEDARTNPVSDAEVDRVRIRALRNVDDALANPTALGVSLSESIAAGDWRLFFLQRDRWRKVTAADVNRVAAQYLKPANRTVALFVPESKPDRAPNVAAVDVVDMLRDYKGDPALAAGEDFDPTPANLEARTERFVLANGMKIALLPKKTRGEKARFALQLHQGDEKSLSGRTPQGELAAAMLMRGTTKRSRQEIEDALDRLHSRLNINGTETRTLATGETTRSDVADALKLVAEVLREPAFPAREFELLKREQIAALEAERQSPEAVTSRALGRYRNPYPRDDVRYMPTLDEELQKLSATTIDDVKTFHRQFFGGSYAELAVVGDFDAASLRTLVTDLFGTWVTPTPFARVPDPLVTKPATSIEIETPDKANAAMLAQFGIPVRDTSSDYPALVIANHILGTPGASRLWSRVREKEGLSYGIRSSFDASSFEPNATIGMFAIFAPQNLGKLRAVLAEELARAVRDGFTDAEVAQAKDGVLKQRQLARTQDASVAAALMQQSYLDRRFDFAARIDAAIAALSTADVNAALRKYVSPDGFAYAYGGDFAKSR